MTQYRLNNPAKLNSKVLLTLAALLGLIALILDAYVSHAPLTSLTPQKINQLKTAIHYQQYHAVLLVALSLWLLTQPATTNRWLMLSGHDKNLGRYL